MKRSLIFVLAMGVLLGACTKEKIIERPASDESKVEVNQGMDAEELALAGEQLVSPWNFMLAQKAFDMALAKDPKNERALFYSAFLKPWMIKKGLATRLRPLQKNQASYNESIKSFPNSALKTFLLEGQPDIKTATDLQNYLVQYRDSWNDFRKFLIANAGMTLTLNLNPDVFRQQVSEDMSDRCKVEEHDGGFTVICDTETLYQRKINAADLLTIRQMAASYVLYFSLLTSYSVEGLEQLIAEEEKGPLTEQERNEFIENILPNAAKLRSDNSLKSVIDIGSDLTNAARWVIQYQAQLCPKNNANGKKRPGYLFDGDMFCIEDVVQAGKNIQEFERMMQGPVDHTLATGDGQLKTTKVNHFAWFKNPIQDLRTVMPKTYNACGEAQTLRDKTMGGYFVNGDAEEFTITPCKK